MTGLKRGTKELESFLNALNETIKGVAGWRPAMELLGLTERGHETTLPSSDMENLRTSKVDYPFMIRLDELTKALGPPIQLNRIFELVQQEIEQSPPRVEFDPTSREFKVDDQDFFRATLFLALPFLKEDGRIDKCKQCNKFILARGKTKLFCSDACRKKHFPQKPYKPARSPYFKEYHKNYRKYDEMAEWPEKVLAEFRKKFPHETERQNRKGEIHGKKTKSK